MGETTRYAERFDRWGRLSREFDRDYTTVRGLAPEADAKARRRAWLIVLATIVAILAGVLFGTGYPALPPWPESV